MRVNVRYRLDQDSENKRSPVCTAVLKINQAKKKKTKFNENGKLVSEGVRVRQLD